MQLIKFFDKKKNEIKEAYLVRVDEKYAYLKFGSGDTEYHYSRENIEILENESDKSIAVPKQQPIPYEFRNMPVPPIPKGMPVPQHLINNKAINYKENPRLPFIVYTYNRECYICHKKTQILTYLIYYDGNDSLIYPWDMNRLLRGQNIFAHLQNPKIEYYGVNVLGNYEPYDKIMLENFPDRIAVRYSNTVKCSYAMNLCQHCGAKQGRNYIYEYANQMIKDKKKIDIWKKA